MIYTNRLTVAAACMAATLAGGGAASAATWQQAYLEPAVHAWMGVVTLLASDGEREEAKERDEQCEGDCGDGECKKCDHKRGDRKGLGDWHHGKPRHGHGPHHGHMGPHDGPRGDALTLLHDINMRLGRIERMLAARGPGGPPPMAHRHHGHHGRHPGMEGPKNEMYQRMSEARKKYENASPEERAEMKAKWEARMKEGREKMEAARAKWENASPEEREEMKKKFEARMKEGRAKMEAVREKWENASPEERAEMKKKWEARMREAREGRGDKPEAVRPTGEDAARRKTELENRLKRLEAELQRVRTALESSGT